jgi:hypothetical protein
MCTTRPNCDAVGDDRSALENKPEMVVIPRQLLSDFCRYIEAMRPEWEERGIEVELRACPADGPYSVTVELLVGTLAGTFSVWSNGYCDHGVGDLDSGPNYDWTLTRLRDSEELSREFLGFLCRFTQLTYGPNAETIPSHPWQPDVSRNPDSLQQS